MLGQIGRFVFEYSSATVCDTSPISSVDTCLITDERKQLTFKSNFGALRETGLGTHIHAEEFILIPTASSII